MNCKIEDWSLRDTNDAYNTTQINKAGCETWDFRVPRPKKLESVGHVALAVRSLSMRRL